MAELKMSDEQRRQELNDKFKNIEGWADPSVEYRIEEKEQDASRISAKLIHQLENLLLNTSLLAVPNELLNELLVQSSAFMAALEIEVQRRV